MVLKRCVDGCRAALVQQREESGGSVAARSHPAADEGHANGGRPPVKVQRSLSDKDRSKGVEKDLRHSSKSADAATGGSLLRYYICISNAKFV